VTFRERLAKLDRIQQSLGFRIGASIFVTLVVVVLAVTHVVARNAPVASGTGSDSGVAAGSALAPQEGESGAQRLERERLNAGIAASDKIITSIMSRGSTSNRLYTMALLGWCVAIGAIWLGVGLTMGGVLVGGAAVLLPMYIFMPSLRGTATLLAGVLILFISLITLMRVAGMLLSAPYRSIAIARNVLTEATRLKLTSIFILILIFGLAALPGLLDPNTPLRYRVQSFLQWGTGGTFFIISLLTVVFSVATVAFEQRDKVIWQTMTKPVAHWEYILGKWLGVTVLAGVLLLVSSSGIYLFAQYLRQQPALGESSAYVSGDGDGRVTDDRRVLETQILVARLTKQPQPPEVDQKQFDLNVQTKVEEEANRILGSGSSGVEAFAQRSDEMREKISSDLRKSVNIAYRTLDVGQTQYFMFEGLGSARNSSTPVILRYKINSGTDRPDALYRLTFIFPGVQGALVQEVGLAKFHYLELLPTVVDAEGKLVVGIANGDFETRRPNPFGLSFPKDGLEVSFSVGSFEANFVRVVAVLWLKLAFLAMVGVFMATFTSFPVACLVSFAIYASAEGATFLLGALENYRTQTNEGQTLYFNVGIAFIATWISKAFKVYSDLQPTSRLVDGRLLGWSDVAQGTVVLACWIGVLFLAAVTTFRRRELATYSGNG